MRFGQLTAENVSLSTCSFGVPHFHFEIGSAELVGSGDSAQFDYPAGNAFIPVDADDPPGTHLLYLVTGRLSPTNDLLARLSSVGAPPREVLEAVSSHRGPGARRRSNSTLDQPFLNRVDHALNGIVTPVHSLFLPATPSANRR